MRTTIAAAAVALLVTACSGGSSAPAPSPSPTFSRGTVLIDTDGDTVLLHSLFAQTPEQRSRGLTDARVLPEGWAMVFVFFHSTTAPVPKTAASIPLSVALFDVDGRILEIFDVAACESTPCPVPDPGVAYMGAIATRQGLFEERGVTVGDVVHAVPGGE